MARSIPPIPNLQRFEIAFTVELYTLLAQTSRQYVTKDEMGEALGIAPGLLVPLAKRACANSYYGFDRGNDALLHSDGLDMIVDAGRNAHSPVHEYLNSSKDWIFDQTPLSIRAPEDDVWQPLDIDRSTPAYVEAVSAAKEALAEIESSNGYAASEPEERDTIVYSIRGTIDAIETSRPTRAQVYAGLIGPLKYLSDKFASASIGEIAKRAVSLILAWIGS